MPAETTKRPLAATDAHPPAKKAKKRASSSGGAPSSSTPPLGKFLASSASLLPLLDLPSMPS